VSTFELKMTSYGGEPRPRVGFFTDTSLCIGCKACEVACKTWNDVPEDGLDFTGMSLDNTKTLDADTWRHVAFVEQRVKLDDLVVQASLPAGLQVRDETPSRGCAGS
jgi:formate dehydrogenase iron-sulfur subunit